MCSLPSAALGKGFAECNLAFAECLRHSAKNLNPVVSVKREHVKLKPPEVIAHAGAHVDRLFVRN